MSYSMFVSFSYTCSQAKYGKLIVAIFNNGFNTLFKFFFNLGKVLFN